MTASTSWISKLLGTVCNQHSPGKRSAPGALRTDALRLPGAAFVFTRTTCYDLARHPDNPGCGAQGYPRIEGEADQGSDSDCCPLPDMALESFTIIR